MVAAVVADVVGFCILVGEDHYVRNSLHQQHLHTVVALVAVHNVQLPQVEGVVEGVASPRPQEGVAEANLQQQAGEEYPKVQLVVVAYLREAVDCFPQSEVHLEEPQVVLCLPSFHPTLP